MFSMMLVRMMDPEGVPGVPVAPKPEEREESGSGSGSGGRSLDCGVEVAGDEDEPGKCDAASRFKSCNICRCGEDDDDDDDDAVAPPLAVAPPVAVVPGTSVVDSMRGVGESIPDPPPSSDVDNTLLSVPASPTPAVTVASLSAVALSLVADNSDPVPSVPVPVPVAVAPAPEPCCKSYLR